MAMSSILLSRSCIKIIGSCNYFSTGPPKPYNQIPGPRGLPIVGTGLELARLGDKALTIFDKRIKQYGRIWREKMFPGQPEMVFASDPKDVETVFRADDKFPIRPDIAIVFTEMRNQSGLNKPHSIIPSNGEEWYRQRQPMSQFMSVPRRVSIYHKGFNEVASDFMNLIKQQRDQDNFILSDVVPFVFKWSFESVAQFVFGKRLGCLHLESSNSEGQLFINEIQHLFALIQDLMYYPVKLFRYIPFKKWKELLNSQTRALEISQRWITEKEKEIDIFRQKVESGEEEIPEDVDFMTFMILSGKMNKQELAMCANDMIGAGVDTTGLTLSWCLYNLACNPVTQRKLRSEVLSVVGDNEVITPEHIQNMSYLRNCVKETLRLYSIAFATFRTLQRDVVLSGYNVPAGKSVAILLTAMGRSPDVFEYPDMFIPERWNREEEHVRNTFAHVPFGFGPRMCVGRRVAELNLHVTLAHIMKNFILEYPDKKPMNTKMTAVLKPERRLNIVFKNL